MNNTSLLKQHKNKIIEVVIYTLLFLIFVRLIAMQFINGPDYRVHVGIIEKYVQGNFYIPHPAFHLAIYWLSQITSISYANISPFFSAFVIIITIFITQKVLVYFVPEIKNPVIYLFFSVAINIVIALYLPFFNRQMYLGQWSPNIWHSPTMTLLKPFALLGFFWIAIILKNQDYKNPGLLFLSSLSLFIGTFVKPSFIICFIPTVAIYLILNNYKQYNLYLKFFWIFLPSLLLLTYQYIETYSLSQTSSYFHDNIKLTWFGVTKIRTKSVLISTLLVTAFPLSVLSVTYKRIRQNIPLYLSWILLIVSFLVSGLLAEQYKFTQGAFIFSYIICLFIVYVFSLCEYLHWFSEFKRNILKISIVGMVFLYHLISGILYLIRLLNIGSI